MNQRHVYSLLAAGTLVTGLLVTTSMSASATGNVSYSSWKGCANSARLCTEVQDPLSVFGHYVGHDEPSMLFDSNVPGSGNHMS